MMMIDRLPAALTWRKGSGIFDSVYDSYLDFLGKTLGRLLGYLQRDDRRSYDELTAAIRQTCDPGFVRVLTAPEVTRRLLAPQLYSPTEVAAFLMAALRVEAARAGDKMSFAEPCWSAIGDMVCNPDGTIVQFPQIEGFMPLDFGSPFAIHVDLSGQNDRNPDPNPPFNRFETEFLTNTLREAQASLRKTNSTILEFSSRFNVVLILQKDTVDAPFSSGSTRQYVGRSCLGNPQIASVEDIANGIVHEGIHGLLYMEEVQEEWVSDPELRDSTRRVVSPWTGTHLALRPFLQACFVWYGLAQFWSQAMANNGFGETREARAWFEQALVGFTKGPLLECIHEFAGSISAEVKNAISEMQEAIVSAMRAVT